VKAKEEGIKEAERILAEKEIEFKELSAKLDQANAEVAQTQGNDSNLKSLICCFFHIHSYDVMFSCSKI
jgi:predicted tellurium resistance membrane protein TerC